MTSKTQHSTLPLLGNQNYIRKTKGKTNQNNDNESLLIPTDGLKKQTKCAPSFLKLIKDLRESYPLDKTEEKYGNKSQIVEKTEQPIELEDICHETGERLSTQELTKNVDVKDRKGVSFSPDALIMDALIENSAEDLAKLLEEHNVDVNIINPNGETLLHVAAKEGDIECLQTLIKHGADPNRKSTDGWPPVHSALQQAHLPAMVYLIECGTNMEEYTQMRIHEFEKVKKISKSVYMDEEVFV